MRLSRRAELTPPSPIRRLAPFALKARERGVKVYHLNIGQPDIISPPEFLEGVRSYNESVVAYEQSGGNDRLRDAWSNYFNSSLNLKSTREDFLITTGASEALIFLFMICCDPGDEIVVIDPTYANYKSFAATAGVNLVPIPSLLDEEFKLPRVEELESRITERTKAILICNPNNPTGTVYTREELQKLLELCRRHNLYFLIDETYREFVYDGRTPLSAFHIAPDDERIVVVDSLSKRFSLCGARIGCLITKNREILQATMNLAQARLASPTIDQTAAAYLLERVTGGFIKSVVDEYESRRNVAVAALSKITGVVTHNPHGAFYTVARLPIPNAEEFASYMLSQFNFEGETTFVAPAQGFYMGSGRGADKIRIAFVLKQADLVRGIEILGKGLEAFYAVKNL